MAKIVGIGANVYDTLITLPYYPKEDTKLRADMVKESGGGPCATGLTAAAKLGESAAYIGNITDDAAGKYLIDDFKRYGVSDEYINIVPGCRSFTSYIWLSEQNASRTCVFEKGSVPALSLNSRQIQAIAGSRLLMVDGNDIEAAIEGAQIAKKSSVIVLYDAGGMYDGVDRLLPLADCLIPSEEFALKLTGAANAEEAAKKLFNMYSPDVVVVTCGKKGGVCCDNKGVAQYPSFSVAAVDSNGAGDVFHGAYAFAVVNGMDHYKACIFSSAVSALKCTRLGAREGVPCYDEVVEFLKERGYNEF